MARPNTLSDAVERAASGEPMELVWASFLDLFYAAPHADAMVDMLKQEPALTGDERLNSLAAATTEYLWRRYRLGALPEWVRSENRVLSKPWFTTEIVSPGLREYLTFASPAEFIPHNIFTDEAPLRRARSL